jgi:peptide/nickel transport system substrate-binding protein
MHRYLVRMAAPVACLALAVAAAGCGSSSKSSSAPGAPVSGAHKGGTLIVLSNSDFDNIDPGIMYYQLTYEWANAADRPLYSFKPTSATQIVPDLAASMPTISADGKTVTVHIRHGVKFSPPVNREVTSADVKYAIERGFTKQVANGYVSAYYAPLVGSPAPAAGNYAPIPGIETPDKYTIVFKLAKNFGATFAKALVLPLTAPVPKEYAFKYDQQNPSTYGQHQVATGPYMIQMVGGKVNYQPGKEIVLVRNPNWNPSTDYRPAYVDKIDWKIGVDPTVAGREILDGSGMVNGDTPPAAIVKLAATTRPSQITFTPLGNRYVALNTTLPPFNNMNIRKAVNAAINKVAMQLTRGGSIAGYVATHILPPGAPGFVEAGGFNGPGYDFTSHPAGDLALAANYLKAAGFASGKYHGPPILMVGDNEDPAAKSAQVVLAALQGLGFNVNFKSVVHDTMYTKFCNVPKVKVQVCPNVGWLPDFPDGYAYFFATFDGKAIVQSGNSNWPQLNDPAINAAIDRATAITDPAQRDAAWGQVDRMVTGSAAVIPWFWDKQPNIQSKNVNGVIADWNAAWDLATTSLK